MNVVVAEPQDVAVAQDDLFLKQLDVLKKHLTADPKSLRHLFVADGTQAIAWEFQQPEIGERFIGVLWNLLLRGDDMSTVLQRFIWDVPLKFKRRFIKAIDVHLSARYPMFKGLSENWPAENFIPPYIRPPEQRSHDFDLVNQGYLGYMNLGYSLREVELFVWLEVLRDKQCDERPCEVGVLLEGQKKKKLGGCPVKIHIPEMIDLIGKGRIREALELIEAANPLPDVTGRVCPQENQCQGVCTHTKRPIEIGQLEWYLPEHEKLADPDLMKRFAGHVSPWARANKPPVAVVGSGPSGLINAYLLAVEGFPVTVFEAFHELGGVLRYGIPEFRLPNTLIDDVVAKIDALGGRFVKNFVVGKTATLEDLKQAGFWKIFVGTGAGLPTFMNVPGEHLLGVMSANEFLTRVNLMRALDPKYETPLPEVKDKQILVIGGGNTAMDAARTAKRLGGNVTIVYRRTQAEMPARVEELHHALEEGIDLAVLVSPREFVGDEHTHFVTHAIVDINELGEPDASGRRRPKPTGQTKQMAADLVIMALGNAANPIIKDSEPGLKVSKWGTIEVGEDSQETSIAGVYTGGDAARGGSTAILAAGDGQAAARQIVGDIPFSAGRSAPDGREGRALHRTRPVSPDHRLAHRAVHRHRGNDRACADGRSLRPCRPVRARAGQRRRRAHPPDPGGLECRGRHHRSRYPGHGHVHPADEPHGGGRLIRRHRRPARAAERRQALQGGRDGRVHRRRRRPACDLPDRQGPSQDRQPRHADRRLPFREPPVLDRQGRTPRQAAGGVRRPARRHLHLQRRDLRPEGLRHHAAGRDAQGGGVPRGARSPRSSPSVRR